MIPTRQTSIQDSFVDYLRTGRPPKGLFREDVRARIHIPHGHYDVATPDGLEAELMQWTTEGFDLKLLGLAPTDQGFVVEFTQRVPGGVLWEEMAWVTVEDGTITSIRWYCTGAVHEHHDKEPGA